MKTNREGGKSQGEKDIFTRNESMNSVFEILISRR